MKHTQGRWRVFKNGDYISIETSTGNAVTSFSSDYANHEANAQFICKAVNLHDELVEALEHATKDLQYFEACAASLEGKISFVDVGSVIIKAKAILAKAKEIK
ncbi:MAG: hypothetical protein KAS32_04575 [Candidatus Peribacteraceae bacterium]|nr:hypothetical protein [Candidatus Peribacteraceae bacterium]